VKISTELSSISSNFDEIMPTLTIFCQLSSESPPIASEVTNSTSQEANLPLPGVPTPKGLLWEADFGQKPPQNRSFQALSK